MLQSSPPAAGHGSIRLGRPSSQAPASFSSLSFTYPLKILAPNTLNPSLGAAYILSYGGGLVGGDRISLDVHVERGADLVCLTQGSTKVFKTRPGASPASETEPTVQRMRAIIEDGATLFLFPAPVTCFADAWYSQTQDFELLGDDASLIVLDWFTSGRVHLYGATESWRFRRYRSSNSILGSRASEHLKRTLVKDVQLLEGTQAASLAQHALPYSVYATLLICPPCSLSAAHATTRLFETGRDRASRESQRRQTKAPPMLWSWSEVYRHGRRVGVVRAAAQETDALRGWIEELMLEAGIKEVLGADLFRNAFRS